MIKSSMPFPDSPRLPAHGPVSMTLKGQALMFFFKHSGPNTERADQLAKELMNAPGKAPEGTVALRKPVSFYVETPEAQWVAEQVAKEPWEFVCFIEDVAPHAEHEWDVPGPFRVEADVPSPWILELTFTKLPEET